MIMASCRFSKDRAGFGGASTLRAELLGVGDPSASVKQIKREEIRSLTRTYGRVQRQNDTNKHGQ